MKEESKIDSGELYGTRLLVFLEDTPQSNKYRQLMLNEEEFKKLSFSLGTEAFDFVDISYARDAWDEGWCRYPETLWQKIKDKFNPQP